MKTYYESRNNVDLISDNFLSIWGIFCQQALIGKDLYIVKKLKCTQSNLISNIYQIPQKKEKERERERREKLFNF